MTPVCAFSSLFPCGRGGSTARSGGETGEGAWLRVMLLPSSGTDFVRATFSRKERRKDALPLRDPSAMLPGGPDQIFIRLRCTEGRMRRQSYVGQFGQRMIRRQ